MDLNPLAFYCYLELLLLFLIMNDDIVYVCLYVCVCVRERERVTQGVVTFVSGSQSHSAKSS